MAKAHRSQTANSRSRSLAEIDPFSHDATAAAVGRLTALLEAQESVIRQYEKTAAHSQRVFEQASAAARLGMWECDLRTETLQWSNGTYDLFDLPRGTPLVRKQTLPFYPAHSLTLLESVRSKALRERRGFNLDAEIVTPKGRRWIRISATVDCAGDRPLRLFGIKQDVTEEKEQWERMRYRADIDEMTGLANRSCFQRRLAQVCGDDDGHPALGVLLLIDLDGFKNVNDSLGHRAGDACLQEAARRIQAACDATLVARIGGDEFAVLIENARIGTAMVAARNVIDAMSRPFALGGHAVGIGASIGISAIDDCRSHELFDRADKALYAAKAAGRNTFRISYPRIHR
jgi:diguanylate cyclase (GGDEF)-like protein